MKGTWSFILFIAVVITVYGFLNYYFLRKYKKVVKLKTKAAVLSKSALFVLILSPVSTVFLSRLGPLSLAPISGFIGYSWLAFLFLFLVVHGAADIILFLSRIVRFTATRRLAAPIFWLSLVVGVSILSHGIYEARQITTKKLVIQTDKLPASLKQISILQISDVHFSPVIGVETALKLRRLIMKENPDIIVSTGDLLDPGIRRPKEITDILRSLQAPLGKYAVSGNHEFYMGIKKSQKFTEQAGFKMLRNQAISIENFLNIAGMDDLEAKRFEVSNNISEEDTLSGLDQSRYTILLKHQPVVDSNNLKLFDLQLSGHTHGGQIFPFNILVKLVFPYIAGLYELGEQTKLYVSRGAGSWGPPFRFMAPAEITMIELRGANKRR